MELFCLKRNQNERWTTDFFPATSDKNLDSCITDHTAEKEGNIWKKKQAKNAKQLPFWIVIYSFLLWSGQGKEEGTNSGQRIGAVTIDPEVALWLQISLPGVCTGAPFSVKSSFCTLNQRSGVHCKQDFRRLAFLKQRGWLFLLFCLQIIPPET